MINEHDCVVLTNDPDTLVQLFCLSSSVIIGRRYEYERTRISRCALFIGIGIVNEQRTNRAEEL
jgi:hypothetical protein